MEKLIHDDRNFIEKYFTCINLNKEMSDPACKEDLTDKYKKSLTEVYKILLKESYDKYDYQFFLRWNLYTKLSELSKNFNNTQEKDEERIYFEKLEERYLGIIEESTYKTKELEFKTKVSELRSNINCIKIKMEILGPNEPVKRLIQLSVIHISLCFQNVLGCWPYYPDKVSQVEMKDFFDKIINFLVRIKDQDHVEILNNIYYSVKEKIKNEKSYGKIQYKNIIKALSQYEEYLKKDFFKRLIETFKLNFEKYKINFYEILKSTYSIGKTVYQLLNDPLEFANNELSTNLSIVGRHILNFLKNNKILLSATLIGLAIISVGAIVGLVADKLISGVIVIYATNSIIQYKVEKQLKNMEIIKTLDKKIKEGLNNSHENIGKPLFNDINSFFTNWISRFSSRYDLNKIQSLNSLRNSNNYNKLLTFFNSLEESEINFEENIYTSLTINDNGL